MTVPDPATSGPYGAPYLAVDVQPDVVAGAFVLGVSELGGTDVLGGTGEEARWVNVVCDVTRLSLRRGATTLAGVLTRAEAGGATVTVTDWTGQLDPLRNADSVHRGTPFRLRAWGWLIDPDTEEVVDWSSTLFTGRVDELTATYLPGQPATVVVTASDVIAELAGWEAPGRGGDGVGAGDRLEQRVDRILQESGIVTGINPILSDSAFVAVLLPTRLQRAWDEIVAATDAELGRVWADERNFLVLRNRYGQVTGPVRGTLSDLHSDAQDAPHCCMADATVVHGFDVTNRVVASRRALPSESQDSLTVVRRDDLYSQARYGLNTLDRTAQLEVDDVLQVTAWCDAVIAASGVPVLRVDAVTPSPTQDVLDEALVQWPAVLSTQIGDRWRFRFHPEGLVVDEYVEVQGIQLDLTPDEWSVVWTTVHGGSTRPVRPRPDPFTAAADVPQPAT